MARLYQMVTLTPARIAAGLTHKVGNTGFEFRRGAHYPWEYVLYFNGEGIAGVDADFIPKPRKALAYIPEKKHD
jgi:hypothetical protein